MLSYKLDFSSCAWKPGFVKSSHIFTYHDIDSKTKLNDNYGAL